MIRKITACILSCLSVMLIFSACANSKNPAAGNSEKMSGTANTDSAKDTLTVGYEKFSGIFNPFFASTAYDTDVAQMTGVKLLDTDRSGKIVLSGIKGETSVYNGTQYTYEGIADCSITENDDNSVVYDFKLRDDLKFSDGTPLTADDVIFTMYVLADPSYTGSSEFRTVPILGLEEYRSGMDSLANLISSAGRKNRSSKYWTEEQQTSFWSEFDKAGEKFVKTLVDYASENHADSVTDSYGGKWGNQIIGNEGLETAYAMVLLGFGKWDSEMLYTEDNSGTFGLSHREYAPLYVKTEDVSSAAAVGTDGTMYAKADAGSTQVYIMSSPGSSTSPASEFEEYTGERYVQTVSYSGAFTDITDKEYDCTSVYPSLSDFWNAVQEHYINKETGKVDYAALDSGETVSKSLFGILSDTAPQFNTSAAFGESAPSIKGIVKTGNMSFSVTTVKYDAVAVCHMAFIVAPLHYYANAQEYNYNENKFGFTKGDLSAIRAKNAAPMGAGPYIFTGYENGTVSFEANEYYYLGSPSVKHVKFVETAGLAENVSDIVSGDIDMCESPLSAADIGYISQCGENGVFADNNITCIPAENNGYGYIGICADNVLVGKAAGSEESKALRKAFAVIFSAARYTAVSSYYGDFAQVIEYPISSTSWAAPQPGDSGYARAYSTDSGGKTIYAVGMNGEQMLTAAVAAARGYLEKAGYTFDKSGIAKTAPRGARLTYTIVIPADGTGVHPSYGIATAAKQALASIGIGLEINDPADSNEMWNELYAGKLDMWAAAWQSALDPDMYNMYYSTNVPSNAEGSRGNLYCIADSTLDSLIIEARASSDTAVRKSKYKACLDTVMEWAVEVPVYQSKHCFIYSAARISADTVPSDITRFYSWQNCIHSIALA